MRRRAVLQALEGAFSNGEMEKALSGIDIVGDIGIVKLPEAFIDRRHEVGRRILERLPSLKSVYRQTAPVSVVERVRGLEWLAGEERTTTEYAEHGCVFRVDVAQVYFSPRLSFERLRIAKMAVPGEVAVNMFAGVGTFSIVMVKRARVAKVYSIDSNPVAIELMNENVSINSMEGRVVPLNGDARNFVQSLQGQADRVLMPLPELAIDYFKFAVEYLKRRGWIHVYIHVAAMTREDAASSGVNQVMGAARGMFNIEKVQSRVVRSIGSRNFQVAVDVFGERGGNHD